MGYAIQGLPNAFASFQLALVTLSSLPFGSEFSGVESSSHTLGRFRPKPIF
jgi:hypothetical protein